MKKKIASLLFFVFVFVLAKRIKSLVKFNSKSSGLHSHPSEIIKVTIDDLQDPSFIKKTIDEYSTDDQYTEFSHHESDKCFLCSNIDDPYLSLDGENYNHEYKIKDSITRHMITKCTEKES